MLLSRNSSWVLQIIKSIRTSYQWITNWVAGLCISVSPILFAKIRFKIKTGNWINLDHPKGFDEKLNWLNLYWRHPLKTRCGDKYGMRSYVEEKGLSSILPTLLGVYRNTAEINFKDLPERFVLKCTHGCGFNIVCKNKRDLDINEAKQRFDSWMKVDYGKIYGELHYSAMTPRIICEAFLDDLDSELPSDFKVYCFAGKAHCTMACTRRKLNGRANYDIYDIEWRNKLPYSKTSLRANRSIPKPEAYEEIISAAEVLSKSFPFVRMDFYSIRGRAVLGEMTFTPAGCIDINITDLGQAALGELLKLPDRYMG